MVLPAFNCVLDLHPSEIHGLSLSEVARVMDSAPMPSLPWITTGFSYFREQGCRGLLGL